MAPIIAILTILVVVATSWTLLRYVGGTFLAPDYDGTGQALVNITVQPGDGADDIGATLVKAGVVKSTRAFANAAKKSGQGDDIQPGVYQVLVHSSAAVTIGAILDSKNRMVARVTIPEGYTERQVLADLADTTGNAESELADAVSKIDNLGIPDGFKAKSAEGFLFPSTYNFNAGLSADAVVQALTARFSAVDQQMSFQAAAKALKLSPYDALIVASMVESEAKFDEERPKIARVILNRLAMHRALQIDATSVYEARLAGQDPAGINYTLDTPYSTRIRKGLPPTPISNPGSQSLEATIHPAVGPWLFYVRSDGEGHHFFTSDEKAFNAAAVKCHANKWGCS
jgi:UPF0755 protein